MNSPLTGNTNVNVIYRQLPVPIFQNKVYNSYEEAVGVTVSEIMLAQCEETGFVFNANFSMDLLEYDSNYQNEQSNSGIFQEHLEGVIDLLEKKGLLKDKVLEIGCGKGFFLDMLSERGVDICGIDPTYEGGSSKIIKAYYGDKYSYLNANLIILRHTLEHLPNPLEFLQMIAKANNYKGSIYIEIPTLEWIVENNAIEDVFYEHCNYFTKRTVELLFDKSNVTYSFNGQYLSIIAQLSDVRKEVRKESNHEQFEIKFQDKLIEYKELVKDKNGLAIWGAGAKGSVFLNLLGEESKNIECVIDINPKKQNKYIGGTGHEIISPEKISDYKVKNIIVMNKNYYNEIKNSVKDKNVNIFTL